MLKIVFGYGLDDETAIVSAIAEYNSTIGRKTYHESKVRQIQPNGGITQFRCEIWYTVADPSAAEQQREAEKFMFIGSDDIDPYDPDWREKMAKQQADAIQANKDEQKAWEASIEQTSCTSIKVDTINTGDVNIER